MLVRAPAFARRGKGGGWQFLLSFQSHLSYFRSALNQFNLHAAFTLKIKPCTLGRNYFWYYFLTIWFWTPITDTIGEWLSDSAVTVQKPYSFELQGSKLDMCLSPDGNFLATAGEHSFALWDIHSRKIVTRITLDRDIEWIRYSNDGGSLIMKTDDSVKLWDTKKWTVLKSYDPQEFLHLGELIQLTAASGNELIGVLMSSDKQYTTIYDIAAAKKLLQLGREFRGYIGFDSSSKHLAAYSRHPSRLVLWDLTSGIEEDTIPADEFTGAFASAPTGDSLHGIRADASWYTTA